MVSRLVLVVQKVCAFPFIAAGHVTTSNKPIPFKHIPPPTLTIPRVLHAVHARHTVWLLHYHDSAKDVAITPANLSIAVGPRSWDVSSRNRTVVVDDGRRGGVRRREESIPPTSTFAGTSHDAVHLETEEDTMCRFLIYSGQSPILLSHLITSPTHSILTQSYDSRLRLDTTRPHNGDGFGVGYYTVVPSTRRRGNSDAAYRASAQKEEVIDLGPEPCIFTSTIPAWNCRNLERLASKTVSPLIFAHVRATTEGALSDSNCHPFSRGALMWMHNGGIGGWKLGVKRKLVTDVADRWFEGVGGSTDSEWAFALFLDSLEKMGIDADDEVKQRDGFGHTVLRKAMLKTIERINGFIKALPEAAREAGDTRSLLNFAVTDGKSVVCTRYVSSRTDEAASLFFSSGTSWREQTGAGGRTGPPRVGKGEYKMERRDKGADIVLVASEPLTFERDNWVTVPTNSVLTIHNQTVLIHPILDEHYNHTPNLPRSSRFAADKGQTVGAGVAEGPNGTAVLARKNSVDDLTGGRPGLGLAAA